MTIKKRSSHFKMILKTWEIFSIFKEGNTVIITHHEKWRARQRPASISQTAIYSGHSAGDLNMILTSERHLTQKAIVTIFINQCEHKTNKKETTQFSIFNSIKKWVIIPKLRDLSLKTSQGENFLNSFTTWVLPNSLAIQPQDRITYRVLNTTLKRILLIISITIILRRT